ncbi:MAG: MarC family protein [Candidatus Hydrogenedentes bacterium]|nr:MarC family protein [Candidatus Hydrogenedentota bacterium]
MVAEIARRIFQDALVLFAMVNIVGNLPVFADITAHLTPTEKRRAFDTAVITGGSIVLAFALFGNWMLQSVFQVDIDAFKIAGGILVFIVAARGVILGSVTAPQVHAQADRNLGVFPLGFPFMAGPGTIVTTVLLMQHHGHIVTGLSAILVYAAALPILRLIPSITRATGQVAMMVTARILYIFVCAKATTFVLAGLQNSLAIGP